MKYLITAAAAVAGLLLACRPGERLAGGTTDTGNAISAFLSGQAFDSSGVPAAGALVRLRPADYLSPLPVSSKRGVADYDGSTDPDGRFSIEDIDSGAYRLEVALVRDGEADGLAAVQDADLRAPAGLPDAKLDLGRFPVTRSGRIMGGMRLRRAARRAFVQVYGLERLAEAGTATGRFSLALPAGSHRLRLSDPECGPACLSELDVEVKAGEAQDVGIVDLRGGEAGDTAFAAWAHGARIGINTSSAGADVAETLEGFPLLVRLDSSFFPFAQARADGADLRFANAGGTALPFEVEEWDPAAGRAAVWVRVDTVRGHDAAQSIRVFWGNPAAPAAADGKAVFDTADGFGGVWHLAEGAMAPAYRDATAHGNHGYAHAGTGGDATAGAAGGAHSLEGSRGIHVPDAPGLRVGAGDFAVSAWVRDRGGAGTRQVLCKRTASADYELQVAPDGRAEGYAGREPLIGKVTGATATTDGGWHLLTLVRRGDGLELYRDGEPDGAIAVAAGDADNASDLFLGVDPAKPSGEPWAGELDEVRLQLRAPSAAWIRFCHRSQRPGSQILEWSGIR